MYSIGIDIGGTNTDIGLVTENGSIIARRNLPTASYTDYHLYVKDIMGQINDMLSGNKLKLGDLSGIGIGAPNGNFYTGCVDYAPNLNMKGLLEFEKEFHKYADIPVVLSNDANAAAYGEYVYGGAKGMKHFIMFTLGTGVGSGIVVDGKLVHGSTGAAGELGHNILIPGGRQCGCGRQGCLEAYASARGIVRTYCELRAESKCQGECQKDWISPSVPDSEVTSLMIGRAANAGEPLALETYRRTADLLGLAMANAVTFSAPEAIFLMGGPTKVGEPLLKPLRESFDKYMLNIYKGKCRIMMSQLKDNEVAILGSAALIHLRK
ncbi:MAG: ROK family protein [Paludibacteraceae bacterium]|nr:ROK family protein [Paludibacteraceae bacterium]